MRTVLRSAAVVGAILAASCSGTPEARKQAYFESGNRYFESAKYREAIVEYGNVVQIDERFGPARARLAVCYERIGDLRRASGEYIRAADLLPDDLELQVTAGNYLLTLQRFEEARLRADVVLKRDAKNLRAQVLLGNALAGLRQFDEAISEIEQAIRLDPERAGTYAQLGALESTRGERAAAERAFLKAIELAPNWIPAQLALANHYWTSRQLDQAETILRRALAAEPQNASANRAMSLFLLATGRVGDAEGYVKVLSSSGKMPLALADYYMVANRAGAAIEELQRLNADGRTRVAAGRRLARAYAVQKDWARAHKIADETLALSPNDPEILLLKGQLYLKENRRAEALESLKRAVQANTNSPSIHFALGQAFASVGDLEQARRAYAEATKLDAGMIRAHVELARLDLRGGDSESAVRRSRDAVQKSPADVDAQIVLIRALRARGETQAADNLLQQLLQRYPSVAAVHVQHALSFLARHDVALARAAFERALKLQPANVDALGGLIALDVASKEMGRAKARIDAEVRNQPSRPELLLIAARTYVADRDLDAAEGFLKRAIELDATLLPAYSMLGQLYMVRGKLEDAKREFQTVASRQSKPVAPLTMLGVIAQIQGDKNLAQTHFEQVVLMEPRAPIAANNLAWIYAEKGENLDAALQYAQTAHKALPTVAAVQDTLGWVYYKMGVYDRAVAALTESVSQDPRNATYHYHLGLAHRFAGDSQRAQQSLERALSLNATFEGADDARRVLAELASAPKTSLPD
jgi:tetratricopeptide (TPR) repeat protein